jgi:hypothetical protein
VTAGEAEFRIVVNRAVSTGLRARPTSMTEVTRVLPGQDTLLGCWDALARLSSGAQVLRSELSAVAVFPSWAPLNNAILTADPDHVTLAAVVTALRTRYVDAGVAEWALWLPRRIADLDPPDELELAGLKRDTTTLVMVADLGD